MSSPNLRTDRLSTAGPVLEDVLALVHERRGVDFRAYRRAMIERRTEARMLRVAAGTYAEYLRRLATDPGEVDRLIEHLTIKVSRFYRDGAVFDCLRRVMQANLAARPLQRPLYFWSAGCGFGEEAYSLALLSLELAPAEISPGAIVYATDIDERALASAQAGDYPAEALAELPPDLLAAYFRAQPRGGSPAYGVGEELRSRVRFLRHDLSSALEPPDGLRFDLVCCRNVLIYFDQANRDGVESLLRASLLTGAYLCLGEAEWLSITMRDAFEVIDRTARVFRLLGEKTTGGRAR